MTAGNLAELLLFLSGFCRNCEKNQKPFIFPGVLSHTMDLKEFLRDVGEKKAFYLQYFPHKTIAVVRNVKEMIASLKNAPNSVILHHIRSGTNDFANWTKACVGDMELAAKLSKIKIGSDVQKTKDKIIKAFEDRIKALTPAVVKPTPKTVAKKNSGI